MKQKLASLLALILIAASLLALSACTSPFKRKAATSAATTSEDWLNDVTPSTDDSDEDWSERY